MLFHATTECLNVSAESTETHDDVILHFEDSLEIISKGEHLFAEPSISCDADTVLANHSDYSASVVFKDAHNLKVIQISNIIKPAVTSALYCN